MTESDSLPLVDLSLFAPRSGGGLPALAAELDATFRRSGFCYLAGHGIEPRLCDALLAENRRFHAQPQAAKDAVAINRFHRGYMGFASSKIVTSSVEPAQKPNQSESFLVMHELAGDDPALLAGRPLQGPNPWPDNLPGFKEVLLGYDAALSRLARRLVRAIALALGQEAGALDSHFEKPTTFLRLLHYPPQQNPDEEKLYGSAPHTDYGFITFLLQDDQGGLEVLNDAEAWIPAPPKPGCFLVNLGDMAMRWSNGRWRSTRHRVLAAPESRPPHRSTLPNRLGRPAAKR